MRKPKGAISLLTTEDQFLLIEGNYLGDEMEGLFE